MGLDEMPYEDALALLESRKIEADRRIQTLEQGLEAGKFSQPKKVEQELEALHEKRRHAVQHLENVREQGTSPREQGTFLNGLISIFDEIGRRVDHLFHHG